MESCFVHNVIRKPGYIARDGFVVTWFTSIDFEFGLLKAFVWIMWLAAILVCCEAFFENYSKIMPPIFMLTGFAIIFDSIFLLHI